MIKRELYIENLNLKSFVGIGQFKLNYNDLLSSNNLKDSDDKTALDRFFSEIESLQRQFDGSTIQFIKDDYLINEDHLLIACYHVQKAFINQNNILNRKNLELLLYLSANRQIKNGIKAFGIDTRALKTKSLLYCILSPSDNILEINETIIKKLNGIELKYQFNYDLDKYNTIMDFFQINEDQVNVILKSYEELYDKDNIDLIKKFNALYELVCEKMAILSLEKIKLDYT